MKRMSISMPRWKWSRLKRSCGECAPEPGWDRPLITMGAPSASWKSMATGIEPPIRRGWARLPNAVSKASAAARADGRRRSEVQDLDPDPGRAQLRHVHREVLQDASRVLAGDQPHRDLGHRLPGDHRLRA